MNLNQVTVPSKNLSKSVEFYKNLGLVLIVNALPNYARFLCPDGESTFSVHLQENLPKGEGIIVYFEVEDLDKKVNEIISKGIKVEELPEDKPWLWKESRLTDPDGNRIILFHGGENRKNPPWRTK